MAIRKSPRLASALLTILVVPLIALTACDSDDNSADTSDNTMPAPGNNPEDPITLDGLVGNWAGSCVASASEATYSTTGIAVADNVATVTESTYSDNACTTPASPATTTSERSLEFDGTTTTTVLGDASNVSWTIESRTVDGVSDTDGINTTVWDLMLIANDTLYFGDRSGTNDGSSEALRPDTLDEVNILTRN